MKKIILLFLILSFVVSVRSQMVPVPIEANKYGGYIGCLSAEPGNPNRILAAGGASGLFESLNGGLNWGHINSLPAYKISYVSFCPQDKNIVLVAAGRDSKVVQPSGIWRSVNGGRSWANISLPPGMAPRCFQNAGASTITWIPGTDSVLVGTYCGLAISGNKGETWTVVTIDPTGSTPRNNVPDWTGSVVAIDSKNFVANTFTGTFWTNDRGVTWTICIGIDRGSNGSGHALCVTPTEKKILWYYNYGTQLLYSVDSGRMWTRVPITDTGANQPPFVKARRIDNHNYELFIGSGKFISKLSLDSRNASPWTAEPLQPIYLHHPDPQDILFHETTGRPYILCGDGGIQLPNTGDETRWHSVGGGIDGMNGLEVAGMGVQSIYPAVGTETNIYIITWHNDVWWSPDNGRTWSTGGNGVAEAKRLELNGPVVSAANARISLHAWDKGVRLYNRGYTHSLNFISLYKLNANNLSLNYFKKDGRECILVTKDNLEYHIISVDGYTLKKIYQFPSEPDGGAMSYGVSVSYQSDGTPVIYQPFTNRFGDSKLKKIIIGGTIESPVVTSSNANMIGFRKFAIKEEYKTQPLLAANPGNPKHLIAADIWSRAMKYSLDSGHTWTNDVLLTTLVTNYDSLRFEISSNVPEKWISQPQVISFNPFNNDDIYVATLEAGIFRSTDGGRFWNKIRGSEQVKLINDIGFSREGWVYFGSSARGLWKYNSKRLNSFPFYLSADKRIFIHDPSNGAVVPLDITPDNCPACVITLVKNGMIQDFKYNQKNSEPTVILSGINSVFQYYSEKEKEPAIQFSETLNLNSGVWPLISQVNKSGRLVKGIITENGKLRALISADVSLKDIPQSLFFSYEMPASKGVMSMAKDPEPVNKYEMAKGFDPKVVLKRSQNTFEGQLEQKEWVSLSGTGFEAMSKSKHQISLWMGNSLLQENLEADDQGNFSVKFQVPGRSGSQALYIQQQTYNGFIKITIPVEVENAD